MGRMKDWGFGWTALFVVALVFLIFASIYFYDQFMAFREAMRELQELRK